MEQLIQGLLAPLLAIWIVGYGTCYMVGKHGRYAAVSKKIFVDPLIRLLKGFWARNKKAILLIAIGIIIGLWLASQITTPSF